MKVYHMCPFCGKEHYIDLNDEETELYSLYETGFGHIQDMLPMLNATEREFLMTGYCPNCQTILFDSDITSDRIHLAEYPTE